VPAVLAVCFTAITIGCFVVVLAGVGAQRRFAAMLTDFVNNVTHEFRTPVSTIALAADAMGLPAVAADDARRAKYRRIILDECERLRVQTDKVLEMAALERREIALDLAPVDVHDLIGTAVEQFEPAVADRQGRLTMALAAEPSQVDGDEVHLLNVLHNLLDNALKYNERQPAIAVETATTGTRLRIRVRDNGVGLPPGEAKRVFEPYYRVPHGDVHDVKGFGLGLSYVKHIVVAHGGTVRATSEPGQGAVFEIELPLKATAAPGRSAKGDGDDQRRP
jgi:two-component system phosphate regulon sensor histidine kinase PhoR